MQSSFYIPKEQAEKLETLHQHFKKNNRRSSKSSVVADAIDFFYDHVQQSENLHTIVNEQLTPIELFIKEQSDV